MPLQKGAEALKGAVDRAGSGGGDRTPLNFFQWKDKETKVIRFHTELDGIWVVHMHEWIPCKDGKRRSFLCAKDLDRQCELCAAGTKARELGFGVAILRQEIRDENNKLTGYTDWVSEVEVDDGKGGTVKKLQPFVGILRQAPGNFWTYAQGYAEKYGSLTDRDYEIQRQGADLSTRYMFFPGEPCHIDGLHTPVNEDGTPKMNPDKPDEPLRGRYDRFIPDLKAMLEGMGSESYYDQHLRGIKKADSSSNGNGSGEVSYEQIQAAVGGAPAQPASTDLDEDNEFERLRKAQAANQAAAAQGQSY